LSAAGQLFQTQGYDKTSMDEVARQAGVAKMTLYSYFSDKQALFEAAIARGANRAFAGENVVLDPQRPKEVLLGLARGLADLLRHPHVARMTANLFALGDGQPAVREGYYRQGPERMKAVVRDYLQAAHAAGSLTIPDAERASDQFCSLCCDIAQWRIWLNLGQPTDAETAASVQANVDMFMRAYTGSRPHGQQPD
jgi:TetR/AcrR family transcriptional repressor of mexJK operon